MASGSGGVSSFESCIRAQLFSIQASIVEAHEQVFAIVREHAANSGATLHRGTKQGTKSPGGSKAPLRLGSPVLLSGQSEGSSPTCSNDVLAVQHTLSLRTDAGLWPPRADGDQTSGTNFDSSRHSSGLPAIDDFLEREEEKPMPETGSEGDTLAIPGAMPPDQDDSSTESSDKSSGSRVEEQNESKDAFGDYRRSERDSHYYDGLEFELLPMWKPLDYKKRRSVKEALLKARGASIQKSAQLLLLEMDSKDELASTTPVMHWMAINPHSMTRGFWDFCSLILVVYDMIFIPLQLFDIPASLFTVVMAWTTRLFWTLDIVGSFLTGYVRVDGSMEMSLKRIGRRYIQSWFGLDAIIVVADWMEILLGVSGAAGYARMGKASRIIRIVRMVRLLRLVRMQQVMKLIIERIHSERLTIMADILRITTVIVGFAHIMACVWYGISVKGGDNTWVAYYAMLDRGLDIRYTCALHWSFSQFTGGMDEFVPQNLAERIFAIVVFLLAFLLSSVFVSSLTSSMTQFNMIANHHSQKLSTLRKYMQQNKISKQVAMRVQRNAQFALQEQQRFMPEDQVVVMEIISEPLRVEVHFEMYSAAVNVHPFFDRYIEECPQVMKKVCHRAMSMLQVSCGDILFSPGETALQPRMFFVISGGLHYVAASADVFVVEERTWISEAVIWTTWMHRGQLTAQRECRLCIIEAPAFQQVVSKFEHPDFDPRYYAAAFVKDLNSHLTDIVDLPSKNFNYEAALGSRMAWDDQGKQRRRMSYMVGSVKTTIARVKSDGAQLMRSRRESTSRESSSAKAPRSLKHVTPVAPSYHAPSPPGSSPRATSPAGFSPDIADRGSPLQDSQDGDSILS